MKRIFVLLALMVMATRVNPQSISIESQVNKARADVSEAILLTVSTVGSEAEPELPEAEGIQMYLSGRSQQITFINGKMSARRSFSYTVQADRPGQYVIPPFSIIEKGQKFQSEPITIVFTSTGSSRWSNADESDEKHSTRVEDEVPEAVFSTAEVDKKEAVIGEQIKYSYKLFRRVHLVGQPRLELPSFENFLTEQLPPEKTYHKDIQGQRYVVSEINIALFPTQSGELNIQEAKLQCRVQAARSRRDPFSVFDDPSSFFDEDIFGSISAEEVVLKTQPIKINVLALPKKHHSLTHSGGVGRFELSAAIDKNEVDIGSPITLTIGIEGQGNLQSISGPDIQIGNQFKIYDSGETTDIKTEGGIVHGRREIKKVLIPQEAGSLTIPPIAFVYYDPIQKQFQISKSEPLVIRVKDTGVIRAADLENKASVLGTSSAEREKIDIRFIKLNAPGARDHMKNANIMFFLKQLMLPFALFMLSIGYQSSKTLWRLFPASRKKGAMALALKAFKCIEKKGNDASPETFYQQSEKILINYLSDKLGLNLVGMTMNPIVEMMKSSRVNEENIERYRWLLSEINYHRFASTVLQQNRDPFCAEMIIFLKNMDKQL